MLPEAAATNVYPLFVPEASVESMRQLEVDVGTVLPVQEPPRADKLAANPTVGYEELGNHGRVDGANRCHGGRLVGRDTGAQ